MLSNWYLAKELTIVLMIQFFSFYFKSLPIAYTRVMQTNYKQTFTTKTQCCVLHSVKFSLKNFWFLFLKTVLQLFLFFFMMSYYSLNASSHMHMCIRCRQFFTNLSQVSVRWEQSSLPVVRSTFRPDLNIQAVIQVYMLVFDVDLNFSGQSNKFVGLTRLRLF